MNKDLNLLIRNTKNAFENREYELVIALCSEVINIKKKNYELFKYRSQAKILLGRIEEALEDFNFINSKNYLSINDSLKEKYKNDFINTIKYYIDLKISKENYNKSSKYLNSLFKYFQKDVEKFYLLYTKAFIEEKIGDFKEARKYYEQAIVYCLDQIEALIKILVSKKSLGNSIESNKILLDAIHLKCFRLKKLFLNLYSVKLFLEENISSINQINDIIEKDPKIIVCFIEKGAYRVDNKKLETVEKDFKYFLNLQFYINKNYEYRGWKKFFITKDQEAIEELIDIILNNKLSFNFWINSSLLYNKISFPNIENINILDENSYYKKQAEDLLEISKNIENALKNYDQLVFMNKFYLKSYIVDAIIKIDSYKDNYYSNYVSAKTNLREAKSLLASISINNPYSFITKNILQAISDICIEYNDFNEIDLNYIDKNSDNLLHRLVRSYKIEKLENFLRNSLSSKLDINEKNGFGNTALHIAAEIGDKDKITLLIKYNAEKNSQNYNFLSILDFAILAKKFDLVHFLIKNGFKRNILLSENLKIKKYVERNGLLNWEEKYNKKIQAIRPKLNNRFILQSDSWIVTILREKTKEHTLLIVEGIDKYNNFLFRRYEAGYNKEYGKSLLIKCNIQENILFSDKNKEFNKILDGMNKINIIGYSYHINYAEAQKLHDTIIKDKKKKNINYNFLGKGLIVKASASDSNIHNCLSWAQEKLIQCNIVKDREELNSYVSIFATVPSIVITNESFFSATMKERPVQSAAAGGSLLVIGAAVATTSIIASKYCK